MTIHHFSVKLRTMNFRTLVFVLFFSYSVLSLSVNKDKTSDSDSQSGRFFNNKTKGGSSSDLIPGFGAFGGLNVDFYNIFTSFVNQTRQTIPDITHHGNFSLIQLALLCAVGSMAAGAAVIAGEALVFRQHETDLEQYHQALLSSYGTPSPSYGAPMDSYASPSIPDSYAVPLDSNSMSGRKKRDTGQNDAPISYPQIIKSYDTGHHSSIPNLQQLYGNIGNIPFLEGQQGASSSISLRNNPFNQNFQGQQLSSAFQNQYYPIRRPQIGSLKHQGQRLRTRDPSNYEESYRGLLPIRIDPLPHEHKSRRKETRKRNDLLGSARYDTRGFSRRNGDYSDSKQFRKNDFVDNYKSLRKASRLS